MEKYIHLYDTQQEMHTARADWGGAYSEPWLAASKDSDVVTYNDPEYVDIPSEYTIVKNKTTGALYNTLVVSSSSRQNEITSALFYISGYCPDYYNYGGTNCYFYYNGTIYHAEAHIAYGEMDYLSVNIPDGTYQVIYLAK